MIKCAQCGTLDIKSKSVYFTNDGALLGEWPLYYYGALPSEPHMAEAHFCGAECANIWIRAKRDATQG